MFLFVILLVYIITVYYIFIYSYGKEEKVNICFPNWKKVFRFWTFFLSIFRNHREGLKKTLKKRVQSILVSKCF